MASWDFVAYESLASKDRSAFSMGPFGSKITKENYVESGVPVIRGVNLTRGAFVDDGYVFINEEKADEIGPANVKPGDLIFTHRGTIGQVSMVTRNPKFRRYVIGSSQVKTRLDEEIAVPEFYHYWFQSSEGQRSILANASTVGVPGIATPLTSIRNLKVPHPPLWEQTAVAAVLGALDDKIAVNERIAATYEALLQVRFAELGMADEPDGARAIPLTDLIAFNPKLGKPSEEEPVYVDMAALQTNRAGIPSWSRRVPKSGPRFMNGDTLLARITPCLENGKTGYVDFMSDEEIGLGSTEFIVMRSRPGVPSELSYFIARDARFRAHAIRNMAGTSGRQRVSAADASNYLVNEPDPTALGDFGQQASSAFVHMKSLEGESRTLATLRDTLLPQLMSGRLRVKDAERIVEGQV
ncbi:restriction endonuclease subunit S [Streptomyces sp. BV286]|uniref:restriction endonuclease subunit S n=1 Tax=Streptomyces sp. BV286 TaxID=2849672 RepID=UPI001C2E9B15|nr:restriction endonuclease subunit S [Streptomyces sp. BV286]MBV1938211.1 restriction endonuclease subunit S [Streptomyces sp. BV286]